MRVWKSYNSQSIVFGHGVNSTPLWHLHMPQHKIQCWLNWLWLLNFNYQSCLFSTPFGHFYLRCSGRWRDLSHSLLSSRSLPLHGNVLHLPLWLPRRRADCPKWLFCRGQMRHTITHVTLPSMTSISREHCWKFEMRVVFGTWIILYSEEEKESSDRKRGAESLN